MRIGFYNYYESLNRNVMFQKSSASIGDDVMYSCVFLGQQLLKRGHTFSTLDMDKLESFDAVVFMDFPTMGNEYFRQLIAARFENLYLMLLEAPIHRPDNFDPRNHVFFKKIFTWDDALVDGKKYIKINHAWKIPAAIESGNDARSKLCAAIFSNKTSDHPQELYSERIRSFRWFEDNHPDDFDLYGIGWDDYTFKGPKLIRALNRIGVLKRIFTPRYPSLRGPVKSKREVLRRYKFAISYENAKGFPGYITEKIFDCFFAGCVPIYLGAPNVSDHIPPECFIDKRKFRGYEELYAFIHDMPDDVYRRYQKRIREFVFGPKIYPFSPECFAETLIEHVCETDVTPGRS